MVVGDEHVAAVKANLLSDIQAALAYRPRLKKPWADRIALLKEVDLHHYLHSLGRAEPYVNRLRWWTDPMMLIDSAVEEYNNIPLRPDQ